MSRREASEGILHKARRHERQILRIAELEQNHARLTHLYEISTLLMRLSDPQRTLGEVLAVMAQTIPVRSAILMLEASGLPEQTVWQRGAAE